MTETKAMVRPTGRNALLFILMCLPLADVRAQVEAIPGTPFGIAKITVPLDADFQGDPSGILVRERNGRLLYPAVSKGAVRKILRDLIGARGRPAVTVWFLFTGNEPLEITIETPRPRAFIVRPRPDTPRDFDRLIKQWWREYHANVRRLVKEGDHPETVYTFLTSMLSRRLGMQPPLLSRKKEDPRGEVQQTMELLMGIEGLRNAQLRQSSLGTIARAGQPNLPLPPDIQWRPLPALGGGQEGLEPVASKVPPECFYVRFGSFENYLWLNKLTTEYGGDISRMVQMRAYDSGVDPRVQYQLALKQNALAEIMGPAVIRDVVMIGRDAFVHDGAAIGVLFHAKQSKLLAADMASQRATALAKEKANGATLETVKIAGRDVSFLSTPDNRIRSFLVVDGDYHLVTTSRTIARRFIEVAEGAQSLADTAEFRNARFHFPLSRQHTIFIYFSSAFFQGLVTPQYQIELQRRMQAITDAELVRLAKLAAANEGKRHDTIDELIRGRLLPPGFGVRADGSRTEWREGKLVDSMRGRRGTFLPVADVSIRGVTVAEDAAYRRRAEFYQKNWRQMDPVIVGVKRFALNKTGMERVVIDALITPMDDKKYERIISSLGQPVTQRITKTSGDIIWWQASLRGGLISPNTPPHLMFGAIKDQYPLTDLKPDGLLKMYQVLRTTPGYLGAWPQPGFLDRLPLGLAPRPDPAGYAKLPLGLWRRQFGEFAVLAFDPQVLAHVTPRLRVVEGAEPAHMRVEVGDLSKAKLATWVNSLNYERARQASNGNLRLLQTLSQQLGVRKEESRRVAEELLDAKLLCSLGGKYEFKRYANGVEQWRSSKAPTSAHYVVPAEYKAPLLVWFRGLQSTVVRHQDKLSVHAELDMQRKPGQKPAIKLPIFNLLGKKKPAATKDANKKKDATTKDATKKDATKKKSGPRRFE